MAKITDDEFLIELNKGLSLQQIANKYKMKRILHYTRRKRLGLIKPLVKQIPESSKNLTPEKSYVLGVLVGDGCISKSYSNRTKTVLVSKDKEFVDFFQKCLENTYKLKCKRYIYNCKKYIYNGYYWCCLYSKKVVEDLLRYDDNNSRFFTHSWKVPEEIKKASDEIKIMFLRGFVDSEGSVRSNSHCVCLASQNVEGLKEIRLLLEEVGIKSKVYIPISPYLYISRKDNLEKFNQTIGFTIIRKQKAIEHSINSYIFDSSKYRRYDLIIKEYLGGKGLSQLCEKYGHKLRYAFYNAMKRHGISFRQHPFKHPLDLIIKEYLNGKGMTELCNKYGITSADLYLAMKRRNITFRQHPEFRQHHRTRRTEPARKEEGWAIY